jgi:hypothetical protein
MGDNTVGRKARKPRWDIQSYLYRKRFQVVRLVSKSGALHSKSSVQQPRIDNAIIYRTISCVAFKRL